MKEQIKKFIAERLSDNYSELTRKVNAKFCINLSYYEVKKIAKKIESERGIKREQHKRVYNCLGIDTPSACLYCKLQDCYADECSMTDDIELRELLTDIFGY